MRVRDARVSVEGRLVGSLERGLLAYVGIGQGDSGEDARRMADKLIGLRIFEDESGKMNRSLLDVGGGILVVSQFTLMADARKGRRPSFDMAMGHEEALPIYNCLIQLLRANLSEVAEGVFRSRMEVSYTNLGPVTILLDSKGLF